MAAMLADLLTQSMSGKAVQHAHGSVCTELMLPVVAAGTG